ncbi:fatty acid cis/trans isomerase [Rheinheimera maricola]|uniref:Fatty acid cis/trans isomerase n=1 Tax=Rheinheimera maricola TaxID=2793282 RepID=A0ABS7X8P3_9GAMM|nr:fatty acid cis/trans isomerase [Rheinheimera maricola]MBZ9611564.1 fatty acid cis/trans isomerase [Rheinheimera maricola]
MDFTAKSRKTLMFILVLVCAGCAALASMDLDQQYGKAAVTNRAGTAVDSLLNDHYSQHVKPVIEARCVVCHACYDSPCQLNMASTDGITRGAHKEKVYDGARLLAATPNRIFLDASDTQQWRERGFFPVLNERSQSAKANTQASVLARMLTLKQQQPLPDSSLLSDAFDFSLNREQSCPTVEEFENYAQNQPLAGMPYGLPGLTDNEHNLLLNWLKQGASMPEAAPLPTAEQAAVAKLEQWLNADNLKMQLSARYIYEHLFTSQLYFSALHKADATPQFYQLLRSATPPGKPVEVIASRRPFDDPGVKRVYYRLQPVRSTIVNKTHQPYDINADLLAKWQQWFVDADYQVKTLPGYAPEVAANPLTAFLQLPVNSRYRFMLERAENTIMGYIKGPVCRGQVALNVINDHFWVYFVAPELASAADVEAFYLSQRDNLRLPAEKESTTLALSWAGFAKRQGSYVRARSAFLNSAFKDGRHLTLNGIWDGDGNNDNASLTVFRHFDNATVVKGLQGQNPKTAWVIDYALLERIHYLLVAGFDVYGNYGHQLMTRLYMDFLRMEGESNFLAFLPPDMRRQEFNSWYQKAGVELTAFIRDDINSFAQPSGLSFSSDNPKAELYQMLGQHLAARQPKRYQLNNAKLARNSMALLQQLANISGKAASILPELTMLVIEPGNGGEPQPFTLIRNSAHYNVNSLFGEADNRNPAEDNMTLVYGLLGSYPNAFWRLKETDLAKWVAQVQQLQTEQDYRKLLDNIGIRRTAADFWAFSDKLNQQFMRQHPVDSGWLDYNRLENR